MIEADRRFAETAAAPCPYGGASTIWRCHMLDLCDCLDFPEVGDAVAAYNRERGARWPDVDLGQLAHMIAHADDEEAEP